MKLLASDFDGTLYVNQVISAANLEALNMWRKRGHLFVIATGRSYAVIAKRLGAYGVRADAFICNNGAVIYSEDAKRVFTCCIEGAAARQVAAELHGNWGVTFGVSTLTRNVEVPCGEAHQIEGFERVSIDECAALTGVLQFSVSIPTRLAAIEAARRLREAYGGVIEAFPNEASIDIVAKGVDKAEGIAALTRRFGALEDIITVGDSYNDVEMIRRFHGYTLLHASEDMRRIAARAVKDVSGAILENL